MTVAELELPVATPKLKLGVLPVPVSATVCGLPEALSAMLNIPLLVPAAVGLKVTLILQLPPAGTALPHALVSAKSPLAVMDVMLSTALPEFLKETACGVLVKPIARVLNVRVPGLKETPGAAGTPVPLRPIVCGVSKASSAI